MDQYEIDQAIEQGDHDKLVYSQLVPVKVLLMNGRYETRWTDITEVGKEYFADLSSDCQDFVLDLPCYELLNYDETVEMYDYKVDKYQLDNGIHISQLLKEINSAANK